MIPISEAPAESWRNVRFVFTDIDDTLTVDGRLLSSAYQALENLQNIGIGVIPITGRPAGWCDLIARFWPVEGVVGENGAFYFRYQRSLKQMERFYADTVDVREQKRQKLSVLAQQILQEVPAAKVSSDQAYRESDLAIDIAEDVPRLDNHEITKIVSIFEKAGATAKISSIHVNGWFGNYDKLTMTKTFAARCLGMDLDLDSSHSIFIGDSPNDGPMFDFFAQSVGVANIRAFSDQLRTLPCYVTKKFGGAGFSEFTEALISLKKSSLA